MYNMNPDSSFKKYLVFVKHYKNEQLRVDRNTLIKKVVFAKVLRHRGMLLSTQVLSRRASY